MSFFADDRIVLTIRNKTDYIFTRVSMDFSYGGYKSGDSFPNQIGNYGQEATAFMGDNPGFAGVNGYLSFFINQTQLFLYVSSPYWGSNNIGFGTSEDNAYANSSNNNHVETFMIGNSKYQVTLTTTDDVARMLAEFLGPLG